MPTTTNFGWTTPADTDLVKDGASAMRTLGNGIDTSLVYLKGGTTGQILSKTSNTDLAFTWINNDQGDLTAITAGTGISVTSGTGPVPTIAIDTGTTVDKTTAQTLTNKTMSGSSNTFSNISLTSSVTGTLPIGNGGTNLTTYTTGDLPYASASNTLSKLAIGTTGQVLTVSGGVPSWAAASAGALTLITQGTFSSTAGVNIDSCFTSTYTNYLVVWDRITSASTQGQFQFRSGGSTNTNASYNWSSYYIPLGSSPLGYEVGGSQTSVSTGMGESASITSVTMLYVFQPQASQYTTYTWTNQHGGGYTQWGGGRFANTTSFDGIRLAPASGNFTSGSYQVYGLAKS